MRLRSLVVLVTALTLLISLGAAQSASARKIQNPSPPDFFAEIPTGYLEIVGSKASVFKLDFVADNLPNPSLRGTVDSNGNMNFPKAQIVFPPLQLVTGGDVINVTILPTADWTGTIDPLTGRVDIRARLKIQLTGVSGGFSLGNSCFVASDSAPLDITASTHAGAAPSIASLRTVNFVPIASTGPGDPGFAGGPMTGQAYSDEASSWPAEPGPTPSLRARPAGGARVTNDTFAVGGASGCAALGLGNGSVNDALGLPAAAGASRAVLDMVFVPGGSRSGTNALVQKGVKANFTAPGVSTSTWPADEIPELPTQVPATLDGSTSTFSAGPSPAGRFAWDPGSGSFGAFSDSSTQVVSFSTPGLKTVRLQARDADGDIDTKTRQINVVTSTDIGIAKSVPAGSFRGGSNGNYHLDVTNATATRANTQPITVTDSLPAGTSFVAASGSGWSCSSAAGTVTCTRPTGSLAGGATSGIDITVAVSPMAAGTLSNTATVTQIGDPNGANNSSNVITPVRKTDLALSKTHVGTFTANGVHSYTLSLQNLGDADTVGTTTVSDTLPSELTYRAAGSGGDGWSCAPAPGNQVVCTRTATIAAGASAPDITIRARIDRTASGDVTNDATVDTQGDVDAFGGSNSAQDVATVSVVPDLAVTSTHSGTFTVGGTGTYDVDVVNESVLPIAGPTTVAYDLPAGLTLAQAPSGSGWDCAASVVGSDHVDCGYAAGLAAAEAAPTLEVIVAVDHPAYPSTTNQPVVANAQDGYAGNDSDSDPTTVRRLDVSIVKSAVRSFSVGIDGLYRLAVSNDGDADTVGTTTVTDVLPDSVRLKAASGAGWDCSASVVGAQNVSCVRTAPIPAGTSAPVVTVRVTVLDAAADDGEVVNTATVDTPRDTRGVSADDPVNGNNSSTATTPAVSVDLSVDSRHAEPFRVGEDNEFALKVRNVGAIPTVPGAAITVVDDLPDGVIADVGSIDIDRAGWTCSATGGDVTCELTPAAATSAMQPGASASIEIPVSVTDAAPPTADNVATISTEKDASIARSPNNQSVDPTTITRIDLTTTASQSIAPRAGGIGEVTVDVSNTGTHDTIADTVATISLPAGVGYRPAGSTVSGWDCSSPGPGTQITCTDASAIAAGDDAPPLRLRTDVSTSAPDQWTTTVAVTSDGEPATRLDDNDVDVDTTLEKVDLTLTKTHEPGDIRSGRRGAFTLRVTNQGNVATTGTIRVVDNVDPGFATPRATGSGWTCDTTGQVVECTRAAPLAAGAAAPDIRLTVDVPTSTAGTRESAPLARVSHSGDPYPANDKAADAVQVVATSDLSLVKDQPSDLRVGDIATIRYRVGNVGVEAADGFPSARLVDSLPAGLEPLSAQSSDLWDCDLGSGTVNCSLSGPLGEGETSILNVRVRVTRAALPQTGSAARITTGRPGEDPNQANDVSLATSDVTEHDLAISASTPETTFEANRNGLFAISVKNIGAAPTTGPIRVRVPLSDGVLFVDTSVYGTNWECRLDGRTVLCTRTAELAGGATAPDLQVTVKPGRSNAPSFASTFSVETDGDLNSANDTATRTDPVVDNTPPPVTPPTVDTGGGGSTLAAGGTAFDARLLNGSIRLGSIAPVDLAEGTVTLSGASGPGGISLPASGVVFRTLTLPVEVGTLKLNAKIILSAIGPATGTLPLGGGPAAINLPVQAKVEAELDNGTPLLGSTSQCYLTPITFELSGTYDASTKRLSVTAPAVTVPEAGDGCGALGAQVNGLLGLPSSNNAVSLTFALNSAGSTGGAVTPQAPVVAAAKAKFGSISSKLPSNALTAPVRCTGDAKASACKGAVQLVTVVKNGKKSTRVVLAKATKYSVKPGKTQTLKLKLSSSALKLLAKAGKKGLVVTVEMTPSGAKKASSTKSLRLVAPPSKKKTTKK
jgi:uncharacterized repeat protein (TIGR01451 family)